MSDIKIHSYPGWSPGIFPSRSAEIIIVPACGAIHSQTATLTIVRWLYDCSAHSLEAVGHRDSGLDDSSVAFGVSGSSGNIAVRPTGAPVDEQRAGGTKWTASPC